MGKYKIKLDKGGVRALLKSGEMLNACQEKATEIRKRAGYGYATSKHFGKNRINVSVYTKTKKAKQDCKDNNTLLKAMR